MKKFLLFVLCSFLSISLFAQGTETFDNFTATGSSYQTGSFNGQDGSAWTYEKCRGDLEISGKALMIGRNQSPQSYLESGTISGGCGVISLDYMQAFSTNVSLDVQVNGATVATLTSNAQQNTVINSGAITVNVSGDFVIKLIGTTNGAGQVVVDNITWTSYTSSTPTVSTPQFSLNEGIYTTTQNVEITSSTEGASIYYTLDGSEPTEASTSYSSPIAISSTTTIKARAFKADHNESGIASVTYTFPEEVANIAALRAKVGEGGTYMLTSEAIISFMQNSRNQKFIQDATGGITIDDNSGVITTSYAQYDGMTGLVGTLSTYNQLVQFIPAADPGEASSTGNTITPTEVTIPNLEANWDQYESTLIKIVGLTFEDANGAAAFSNSTNYNVTDGNSNAFVIRTGFRDIDLIGEVIPTMANITGVAQRYNTTLQMFPRSSADIASTPTSINKISTSSITIIPNPFENELRVESASDIKAVRLFNTTGQTVKNVATFNGHIDTADIPAGLYILQVKFMDGTSTTQKVIKK